MRRAAVLFWLLASTLSGANPPAVTAAFSHFYNLEYDQALAAFRRLAAHQPENPDLHNHIAQTVLFREMFRVGALESEMVTGNNAFLRRPKMTPSADAQREFDDSIARAMDLAAARLAKDPNDVPALYSKGVSHGLRANYNYLVRKAWMDSLRDATAARKLHARAVELDPNFIDALMVPGLHDYVIGSLPFAYRMLGFLAGYRGDRTGGLAKLERVAREGVSNRIDAEIMLCAIYRREKRPAAAVPIIERLAELFPRNFLLRLELAQFHADTGGKTAALAILDKLEHEKKSGAPALAPLALEKIYYFRGNLLFWYLDLDRARTDLERATAKAEDLDANAAAYSWLRLAEVLDLQGKRQQALPAYRKVIALYPGSDPARDARQYLSSPYRRKNESSD